MPQQLDIADAPANSEIPREWPKDKMEAFPLLDRGPWDIPETAAAILKRLLDARTRREMDLRDGWLSRMDQYVGRCVYLEDGEKLRASIEPDGVVHSAMEAIVFSADKFESWDSKDEPAFEPFFKGTIHNKVRESLRPARRRNAREVIGVQKRDATRHDRAVRLQSVDWELLGDGINRLSHEQQIHLAVGAENAWEFVARCQKSRAKKALRDHLIRRKKLTALQAKDWTDDEILLRYFHGQYDNNPDPSHGSFAADVDSDDSSNSMGD